LSLFEKIKLFNNNNKNKKVRFLLQSINCDKIRARRWLGQKKEGKGNAEGDKKALAIIDEDEKN